MNRLAHWLRDIPIRWKIVSMMLAVTAISLALAGAGLLLQARATFKHEIEQKLTLLADIIGLNSTAALAFNDTAAAIETLAALRSDRHVMCGGLYDTNGQLFARYVRPNARENPPRALDAARDNWTFTADRAVIVRMIRFKERPVGKIYLMADTAEWRTILVKFIYIIALLFSAILVVGLGVSIWMQRLVTRPIADLAQIARRVGQEHDIGLRAVKFGNDELGVLVDGFNTMLDEIGKRRAELRQLNQELEQRVRERTEQLETANKELETFSYSVSHDLRAPLRHISGFSRIVLQDEGPSLSAAGRDNLERVCRAGARMSTLIDDLLRLARITRVEPSRSVVNLSAIAHEIGNGLCEQSPQRQVHFELMPDITARCDAQLLRIALENLLGNAWKFSSGRAEPKIAFGKKIENDTFVYFVSDNGAGFDMEYAGKLFAPFQRLHTEREFPGTGIGLATVERIVRKHGGRIWAESAVDQGATFYFTLEPDRN